MSTRLFIIALLAWFGLAYLAFWWMDHYFGNVKMVICEDIGNGDCQTCPFRAVNDRLVFHCDE